MRLPAFLRQALQGLIRVRGPFTRRAATWAVAGVATGALLGAGHAGAAAPVDLEAFKAPANASAVQALAAYERLAAPDVPQRLGGRNADDAKALRAELAERAVIQRKRIAPATLDALEAKLRLRFPPALRTLYEQTGSFAINGLHGLTLIEPKDSPDFTDAFANYQFEDMFATHSRLLSPKEVQAIRDQFFFFAIGSFEDDGGHARMFYFHKQQGWFGEIQLKDDDHPAMKATEFPALLGLTAPRTTLDALITRQVNRLIVRTLSDTAIPRERLTHADQQLRRESYLGNNY